ncbi:hypothetical protein MJO28_007402 [Puccinia striiformis f. sp. tritici]|uniref:Uncharacterized protein n=1 Tax=Puccinia striiformis f. sp. tritici TaxID=168172 RepID=A0ACC0EFL0_9BASI|nr:hypothetical protein Pst134EA_013513 [Puccinia striiformis f. sp. tritici]KAH9465630.1 hypothetical protein Pst134EA_013513 [Puccinia striiformis f. sp. tritici]KAI7951718.1 hypothetical protein MJO28_007402 [Puccinia striiformis f. sp. tritici]KAI9603892.1 hypothetical protein H4Q26_003500 [Puccinia striiformis f. sp. tritici PST-130]
MPPRSRTTTADAYHGSFDPGVTGRRTGVAPPLKVRRTSNGIEAFSDYFASPRKDPSVSPIRSSNNNKHTNDDQQEQDQQQASKSIPQRARNDRPDMYHEIGERGRKTGISPPKNSTRDENGFENFDNYLIKATEQTNKGIARERRKSIMRRKSSSQALHKRKLSVATFVDDDDDDDEEFMEESMNLGTPDTSASRLGEGRSSHLESGQLKRKKTRSGLSDVIDQSTRTADDSGDLIDFDVVPEGPIHSHSSRHKSHDDEQPMTVEDEQDPDEDEDDDVQNSGGGMAANNGEEGDEDQSVVSDTGYDNLPNPDPPESIEDGDADNDNPPGLEDIAEVEEDEEADPDQNNDPADTSNISKGPAPPKPRKKNPNPPPPAGVRRGTRIRCNRLDHWRGEQIVYGRSTTPEGSKVIGMLDVVRIPSEPPEPFAARRKGRAGTQKIKSESVAPQDHQFGSVIHPEENWDSKTLPNGIVYSYTKHRDRERAIVCTKQMVTLDVDDQAGVEDSFQFQKLFKEADYMAGGLMHIPVGGAKPLKPAKDNCYFFTVVEGAVSVHVHRTTFIVAPSGVFWIPRGNVYSITNISQKTAKLTFAQARRAKVDESDLGSDEDDEHSIIQSHNDNPSASTSTAITKKNTTAAASKKNKNTSINQKMGGDTSISLGKRSNQKGKGKKVATTNKTTTTVGGKKRNAKQTKEKGKTIAKEVDQEEAEEEEEDDEGKQEQEAEAEEEEEEEEAQSSS